MQSTTTPVDLTENTEPSYEDSIEGMLQYHADLSLYYASQVKSAKTSFKREYFKKKQRKNNEKMYKLLVRTPNKFNPLLEYIQTTLKSADKPSDLVDDGSVLVPYSQVVDDNAPPYVPGITTTASSDT